MRIAVMCDNFPELSETFVVNEVAAMQRLGHDVRVVAEARGKRPHLPDGFRVPVTYFDAAPRARKVAAAAQLAARFPRACARDQADLAGWEPDELPRRQPGLAPAALELHAWGVEHIHVHFAAGAAMDGLRIGAILGVPVSLTAHAYDIFLTPRNLPRKLRRAAFVTSGCDYNVRHLRSLVEPARAERIHTIVMGVDAEVFRRTRPAATARHVVSVGRLVEKKGFATLIDAAARMEPGLLERLTIVGEGPLERELGAQITALGLDDVVELTGARTPEEIRALLEEAAVFALPCVIAADGDRDSMPVVLKEAMAMEVPVVGTDAVGLPELIDDGVGRLVAPSDPDALAGALGELLRMAPWQRGVLGADGRERVRERADVDRETQKLMALIAGAS